LILDFPQIAFPRRAERVPGLRISSVPIVSCILSVLPRAGARFPENASSAATQVRLPGPPRAGLFCRVATPRCTAPERQRGSGRTPELEKTIRSACPRPGAREARAPCLRLQTSARAYRKAPAVTRRPSRRVCAARRAAIWANHQVRRFSDTPCCTQTLQVALEKPNNCGKGQLHTCWRASLCKAVPAALIRKTRELTHLDRALMKSEVAPTQRLPTLQEACAMTDAAGGYSLPAPRLLLQ
jgi:hypothetical protein